MNNPQPQSERKWATADWYWLVALLGIVCLAWCAANNRWTAEAWQTPVVYEGDALAQMATSKVFGCEVLPILPKTVASLGAPFGANWNDFPVTEEGVFVWCGLLVRLFGVFLGSNLAVLSGHLLSAASFYLVGRAFGSDRLWAATGGFLFSISHFALVRSLPHLVICFYWHVPIGLLVFWWCASSTSPLGDRKKIFACIAIAIVHGVQNAYYTYIFLQFLILASFVCLARRDEPRRTLFPLFLVGILMATFFLMNVDTLYYRATHGPNPEAILRGYAGLEQYALKPVELFLPFPHRINAFEAWVKKAYFDNTLVHGEVGPSYLGLVGITALVLLAWSVIRAAADHRRLPWHAGLILWVVLYSVIGGINGLVGFGFILFRATNRYSIVIFALALVFLVEQLTRVTRKWHPLAAPVLAGTMSIIGFLDQTPTPPTSSQIKSVRKQVLSDGRFVAALEVNLPQRAMVFQLPIVDFPETPPILQMQVYEHLIPYLYSKSLRFSFGSMKGRRREWWQKELIQLGPAQLVPLLEKYGFSAVCINKKAYEDRGHLLISQLESAGRTRILAESPEFIGMKLSPENRPILPPVFEDPWYGLEVDENKNLRWSGGDAAIILFNPDTQKQSVRVSFRLGSLGPRKVDIFIGSQKMAAVQLGVSDQPPQVIELVLPLSPGANALRFKTDRPARAPNNGDPRKLAFSLIDFYIDKSRS